MDITEVKEQIDEKLNEHLVKHAQKDIRVKNTPGVLDKIQEKIVSRKLLVFGAATALFVWYGLDPDTWGMIAMCYIGGQSAIDFAKVWKGM